MSAIVLNLYGQRITGITIPARSQIDWTGNCFDRTDAIPIDLTSAYVAQTLSPIDPTNGARMAPAITGFVAISAPSTAGVWTNRWTTTDTNLAPGSYFLDIWVTDVNGNRLYLLGWSYITISAGGSPTPPDPSMPPMGLPVYFRGAYDPTVTYGALDAVSFAVLGTTLLFACIKQTTGNDPTNTTYWVQLSIGGIEFLVSDGALAANTYVAPSGGTPGRVVQFDITAPMDPTLADGVTLDAAAGAGVTVRVVRGRGLGVQLLLDVPGGNVTAAEVLYHSETTKGAVSASAGIIEATATISRGPATAGGLVNARF